MSHVPPSRSAESQQARRSPLQLNLTAMIDVVFLLLVYFVLTAAFTEAEGVITSNMPGPQPPPTIPPLEQPIRIMVTPQGETGYRLTIDKSPTSPVSFGDMTRILEGLHKKQGGFFAADNPVIIEAGGRARWQHTVNAFNAALRAGFTNITFATPPTLDP